MRRARAARWWWATTRTSRSWRAKADLYRVRFQEDVHAVLERFGAVPLPPYIHHTPDAADAERYQTVYAERPGAVAAPTAGLHFDRPMLEHLEQRGAHIARVTLHVGAGTFQPVRTEEVGDAPHASRAYDVPRETMDAIAGRRVLAVGTTALRALESAALTGQLRGETSLFVHPGFQFLLVDRLLTNFHLPRSSLLMLAAAFAGLENIRHAYAHAIARALPLLFLRRRHADRKGRVKFTVAHRDGQARRGTAGARARRGGHARLHAGGHLRHGEGHVASGAARGRRADRARQHLPPVAASRAPT